MHWQAGNRPAPGQRVDVTANFGIRFSIRFFILNFYREVSEFAVTCRPVRLLVSTAGRRIPRPAEEYRDIRANMERRQSLDLYWHDTSDIPSKA